jgi:hypothetical protein
VSSFFSCFLFLFAARVSHGRERSPAIQDWQEVGSCAAQTIVGTISRRMFFYGFIRENQVLGCISIHDMFGSEKANFARSVHLAD